MGYTHYWNGRYHLTKNLVEDVKSIIAKAREDGIVLGDWEGNGEPEVSTRLISFNGSAARHEDFETAAFADDSKGFGFCKTGRKPYDVVVGAVLLRIRHYNRNFRIESDGDWDNESEWVPVRALYRKVFGEEPTKPKGME
jgi:hypothetical protein